VPCSTARATSYEELARELQALAATMDDEPPPARCAEARTMLARLKGRLGQIIAIDFFGAEGRETAEGLPRRCASGGAWQRSRSAGRRARSR
jgi:hypothetical protein